MRTAFRKSPQKLARKHLGIVCDVTHDDEVKAAVDKAVSRYGGLDALHNNAGIATAVQTASRNDGCRVGRGVEHQF